MIGFSRGLSFLKILIGLTRTLFWSGQINRREKKVLEDYSKQHKKAWEFDAYDFWVRTAGTPEERRAG